MSDFLTSLTARSFGTETMIRPRISSLFEPIRNFDTGLPEPAAANPTETDLSRENEVEANFERKSRRPQTSLREVRVSDQTNPTSEDPASLVIASPRGDSSRRNTHTSADDDWQPHEWKENDTALTARVRPRKTPLPQAEHLNDSQPLLHPELEDVAPQPLAKSRAISPTRDEPLEKDHRGLVLAPNGVAELTTQMKNAALAMNIANGAPRKDQPASPWPVRPRESEPVVQVTIGRIEVRATSESKSVGRPRLASPVMSLEDYLHRRSQRGNH